MEESLKLIVTLFTKGTLIVPRFRIVFVQNGDYQVMLVPDRINLRIQKLQKSSGDKRVFNDVSWRRNRKIGKPYNVFRDC